MVRALDLAHAGLGAVGSWLGHAASQELDAGHLRRISLSSHANRLVGLAIWEGNRVFALLLGEHIAPGRIDVSNKRFGLGLVLLTFALEQLPLEAVVHGLEDLQLLVLGVQILLYLLHIVLFLGQRVFGDA